jgi:hypothetical protein
MTKKNFARLEKNCTTNKNFARLEKNLREYKKNAVQYFFKRASFSRANPNF